jgi:hypothetical protein
MQTKRRKKTSDYSRRGCVQCKKSHVKCDEKSPACSRCLKKGIECNYVTNFFLENKNLNKNLSSRTAFVWKNNSKPKTAASNKLDKYKSSTNIPNNQSLQHKNIQIVNESENLIFKSKNLCNDQSKILINSPQEINVQLSGYDRMSYINSHPNYTDMRNSRYLFDDDANITNNNKNKNKDGNVTPTIPIKTVNESNTLANDKDINPGSSTPKQVIYGKEFLSPSSYLFAQSQSSPKASKSDSSEHGSSQLSVSNIRLNDLISVEQSDLNYLNSLNKEYETMIYLYNEASHPDLHKFDIPWDGGPCVYFIDTIERNDPIILNNDISLTDQNMIDFVWTFTRITKFFYTFVLFSESSLMSVLDLCFKLGTKSSIFQSIMTYHCSLHVSRIYNQANNQILANLWETRVRIPAFKQCIDYLKEGLESSPTFSDLVILTFAVVIIFSGNASDESWIAHLNGSYQLISKCSILKKTANKEDLFDLAALELYEIIVAWYNHTSFLATLSSLNGFYGKKLKNPSSLSLNINYAIAKNNINLMSGHCLELNSLLDSIDEFLITFNSRGIRLSGLNFVFFILNDNESSQTLHEIKVYGYELFQKLQEIKKSYKYERLPLDDFRMDLSMKYCNLIYIHGIELYITFFFIGKRDRDEVRSLLRDILDLIYSMPYRSSCAIICHWNIYLASMVSLLIEDFEIYGHFLKILGVFQLNGMDVPSIDILERLKLILFERNYEKLLSLENDFVIY